ncbi:MAG: phosphopantothenate synthase [Rhodomicrobium sp.]|nr:MAG: phosphopantothenate synthase [Rhodomicrobium sp.]
MYHSSKKSILLIIGGGIASYKTLDLIRRLKERGIEVHPVLTKAGEEFVTPLSLATLSGNQTHTELFDLKDETEIGHIQLSRQADLVVVAPATADLMAKLANGLANDLASTLLLATDKKVLLAPAMNVRMWEHPANMRNLETLQTDGHLFVGPNKGNMACGETGMGRMAEVPEIISAIENALAPAAGPLTGQSVLVTAGPTHEPIDPVRYIANRSSGKQGYALAKAARDFGATVTLISGPTKLAQPEGVTFVEVETARDMRDAVLAYLPVNIAICAAAVADWRVKKAPDQKMKKSNDGLPELSLTENPDILAALSKKGEERPDLVIGFAAETEKVIEHAKAKRDKKGCDWIIANDVSAKGNVFGNDITTIHIMTPDNVESLENLGKSEAASAIMQRIAAHINSHKAAAE